MNKKTEYKTLGSLLAVSLLSGAILSAPLASADSSDTVNIKVKVPAACTLTATNNNLVKTINPGTSDTIGTANLKAVCNDPDGFAIYAIGYTDNTHGNNYLTTSLGDDYEIPTGTNTSGNTSSWFMTIDNDNVTGNYTATIENSFDNPHIVPDTNTKIATVTSETDQAIGTNLTATFDAYISPSQAAGTYQGKVKFTLVHPNDHPAPADSMLLGGRIVSAKMKSLAAGSNVTFSTNDNKIKAIHMADALPEGFEPTEANTISTADSKHPVYIFFDNTNNAGIMNFYTEGDTIALNPDSRNLFRGLTKLVDISGVADWNTSWAERLNLAFCDANSLNDISALANWDTRNVYDMTTLFSGTSLTSLHGLENWDVSSVETFNYTFSELTKLTDISAIANWNVSNATSMNFMFYGNDLLSDITPLANWDTGNVSNMGNMFRNLPSLVDASAIANWDTSSVTAMYYMFYENSSATTYDLSHWDTSNVTSMKCMFYGNTSLTTLDLSHLDTSSVTDMGCMLAGNPSLATLNLSNLDTSNVTSMWDMFAGDSSLTTLDLSHFDTSNVTNMQGMFNLNTSLVTVDTTGWDTSKVTKMGAMFEVSSGSYVGDGQLREIIGIENWDTGNVTDMGWMFYGAGNMTHYDIANWNVSKVESMNHMFCDNFKLGSLDLSRWNVSNVKTMYDMFDDNYRLTTIGDVSHWNTSSLVDLGGWLNGSSSFVGDNGALDLSGWDTSNLKSAEEVFRAVKLTTIDLTGWTFDAITNSSWEGAGTGVYAEYGTALDRMFQNASLLNTVYVSQSGLNSYNDAVNRGVDITNMWSGAGVSGFTVKP